MDYKIRESSIFVADSHYNNERKEFYIFLKKIESGEIKCSSLFLLGDMFDFISGESKYFIKKNQNVLELLNKLSNSFEIHYFEGNHDYNLKNIFPKIKVYSRQMQPVIFDYEDKKIAISHGDLNMGKGYDIYCKIIRNSLLLKFLNLIDFNNFISKKIEKSLYFKQICRKVENFDTIIEKKLDYDKNIDIVIEGHFHQGDVFHFDNLKYINVPSLFCSKEYIRVKNLDFKKKKL